MVLTQSMAMFKPALRLMAQREDGLIEMLDTEGDVFLYHYAKLGKNAHLTDKRPVRIVLYRANRFVTKAKDSLVFEDASENGQFSQELHEALDTQDAKVCLVSAYKSASRGLNFYVTAADGLQQDFEMLVLANDPYYTRHTRTNGTGFSMEAFQSFCQVRKDKEGDAHQGITQSELLYLFQRNSWALLEPEHYIEILRICMQALGRVERRPEIAPGKQLLFIASDAAHQINLGLRHAQELPERASLTQQAVFQGLDEYMTSKALFKSTDELRAHYRQSKRRAREFRKACKENSRNFRDPASDARSMWEARFDERMFTSPLEYLQMIAENGDDLRYVAGCYFTRPPNAAMFVTNVDEAGDPLEVQGQPYEVITDHKHGTSVYDPASRIVGQALISCMSSRSQKLMEGLRKAVEPNDMSVTLVPQPWFATDILKGYIAEIEFEELISDHFNIKRKIKRTGRRISSQQDGNPFSYLEPMGHPEEAKLYQLFDYYLEIGSDVLIAIDIKNWAPKTDRYRSQELLKRADEKLATLKAMFPNKKIRTLYVNLQGVEKISIPPKRHGAIQFFSMYVRKGKTFSDMAEDPKIWQVNSNFINSIRELESVR
jgi:hypothetical protein